MADQTVRIDFELDASDIAYFKDRLDKARKTWGMGNPDRVLLKAEETVNEALQSNPPRYVKDRITKLELLITMLKDHDWRLEGEDRDRIHEALAYFADSKDMIPDDIPGIGFLDDAIMIELVCLELAPEMDAYEEFCANRDELKAGDAAADPIEKAREDLQSRMRRRRRRRARGGGGDDVITSLFHSG